jgi:thioredoxin 1
MNLSKPTSVLLPLLVFAFVACSQSAEFKMNADQFEQKLKATADAQLIDVRTPDEFRKNHIEGALNLNISSREFENQAKTLDKTKPVMVYCLSGGRSASAAQYLRKQGFTQVYELTGGMIEWNAKKKPAIAGVNSAPGMKPAAFNEHVNKEKLVLVDVYAKWCAPCKKMAPGLQSLKDQYSAEMDLIKVDADANGALMDSLQVQALPTLFLYKNGKKVWSHTGFIETEDIASKIAAQL